MIAFFSSVFKIKHVCGFLRHSVIAHLIDFKHNFFMHWEAQKSLWFTGFTAVVWSPTHSISEASCALSQLQQSAENSVVLYCFLNTPSSCKAVFQKALDPRNGNRYLVKERLLGQTGLAIVTYCIHPSFLGPLLCWLTYSRIWEVLQERNLFLSLFNLTFFKCLQLWSPLWGPHWAFMTQWTTEEPM